MRFLQLSSRTLQRLRAFTLGIFILGFLSYVLPNIVLRIPEVQRWLGRSVSNSLSSSLGVQVRVGAISLLPTTNISITDVVILDTAGRDMLVADRITAGVDILPLFRGDIQVSSVRLFSPKIYLIQDSLSGRLNISPILEKLSSDSSKPSNTLLDIHSLLLRDGALTYSVGSIPQIQIEELSLKLRALSLHQSNLSGMLQEFKGKTLDGFILTNLSAQFQKRGDLLSISNLDIDLPNSEVSIPKLKLRPSGKGLNFIEEIQFAQVDIDPNDITPFFPELVGADLGRLTMKTEVSGRSGRLQVGDFRLALGELFSIRAQSLVSLTQSGQLQHLNLDIESLQISPSIFHTLNRLFPTLGLPQNLEQINSLGTIKYLGALNYQRGGNLQWRGLFTTDLGRWSGRLDGRVGKDGQVEQLDADLQTANFNLAPLLGNLFPVGKVSTDLKLIGTYNAVRKGWELNFVAGLNQAQIQGYSYKGLKLEASKDAMDKIEFSVESLDPQINLVMNGGLSLGQGKPQDIHLNISQMDLAPELFFPKYALRGQRFKASAEVNLSSLDWDKAQGQIQLSSVSLTGARQEPITLDHLELNLATTDTERKISVSSPYLRGTLMGQFTLEHLPQDVLRLLTTELPALSSTLKLPSQRENESSQSAQLDLTIDSLPQGLIRRLDIPLDVQSPLDIQMRYQTAEPSILVALESEKLRYAGYELGKLQLMLSGKNLSLRSDVHASGVELNGAKLNLALRQDSIVLGLGLGIDDIGVDNGSIHIRSQLLSSPKSSGGAELGAQISILPSSLRISNEHWQIAPAHISLSPNQVEIMDLALSTTKRHLFIGGSISNQSTDQLQIDLERINLNYILRAAGVDFNMLETDLTGKLQAYLNKGILYAGGQVRSDHFAVNGVDAGGIDVDLQFNTKDLNILLKGNVLQRQGGYASVDGYIRPSDGAGIDLTFGANRLKVDFISTFMPEVINQISGEGTGNVRLFGKFEKGVTVSGDADLQNARVGIATLGTSYTFNHHLYLSPNEIFFNRIRLYDDEGHSGVVQGRITHDHFSDFTLDLRVSELERVKVYNRSIIKEIPALGVAYASGEALLRGNDNRIDLIVQATSQAKTNLLLDFNRTEATKQEYSITFRNLRNPETDSITKPIEEIKKPSILAVQLNMNITPEAKVGMRLGSGDMNELWAQGEGNIRIDMPPVGMPQVYGNFVVHSGLYTFKLEQLANKRFLLGEGGKLDFRGDYRKAKIDLNAIYSLSANITDLDENLATLARRTNVPVNCVIGLSGEVLSPQIKFSIDLPGAENELERRVRSLMHTDDDVMRQMFSLITLGKFYTDTQQGIRQTDASSNWTAVASSALSEQLSSLLGNLSQNVQLGTTIKTKNSAFDDTDIELLFSGSWLGNRLMLSGNFGYHDNPFLQNTYIGEFDVEYKLNSSGSIRLKGYNHYNNMYQYLRQSMTTQGLGFLFRLRFNSLRDLFTKQTPPVSQLPVLPLSPITPTLTQIREE